MGLIALRRALRSPRIAAHWLSCRSPIGSHLNHQAFSAKASCPPEVPPLGSGLSFFANHGGSNASCFVGVKLPCAILTVRTMPHAPAVPVAEDEGRSIDCDGAGRLLIPGRPGVLPKELPHEVVGRDVPRGLPEALDSRLSAGPRVTTALDDEQDHL